jgi:hypothetical protein
VPLDQALILSIALPMAASVVLVLRAWIFDRWVPLAHLRRSRPDTWTSLTGNPSSPLEAGLASVAALLKTSPVSQRLRDLRMNPDPEFAAIFARSAAAWRRAVISIILMFAWGILVMVFLALRSFSERAA